MLGCVAMDFGPFPSDSWGVHLLKVFRCLSRGSHWGNGPSGSAVFVGGLYCPQAIMRTRSEFLVCRYSLGSLSGSAHYQFLQDSGCVVVFTGRKLGCQLPHRLDQLSVPLYPYQAQVKLSLCLLPPVLSRACAACPPVALDYMVVASRTDIVSGLQTLWVESVQLQDSTGSQKSQVLSPGIIAGLGCPRF
jgi:hypothetical protein